MLTKTKKYFKSHEWFEFRWYWKGKLFYSWWCPIENFFCWIVKSIQYSLFLWNDRDFDFYFILTLFRYKLARVRKHIVGHNILERAEETGQEIKDIEDAISRYLNNEYCDEDYKALEEKWGKAKLRSEPCEDHPGLYKLIGFVSDKAMEEGRVEEEMDELRAIHEEAEKQKQADWRLIWDLMKQNGEGFWD